jgi:hypothetical protein
LGRGTGWPPVTINGLFYMRGHNLNGFTLVELLVSSPLSESLRRCFCDHRAQQFAGAEPPPNGSAQCREGVRTSGLRSDLRPRRRLLSKTLSAGGNKCAVLSS